MKLYQFRQTAPFEPPVQALTTHTLLVSKENGSKNGLPANNQSNEEKLLGFEPIGDPEMTDTCAQVEQKFQANPP